MSNGGDYSDTDVEDVKKFGRVIPVFLASIGFFAVYAQVISFQVQQTLGLNWNGL